MKKIFIRFILFFYLTSSYLSAIHLHKTELVQHEDCKICIVVKNLNGNDVVLATIALSLSHDYQYIVFRQQIVEHQLVKGFDANAPPFFS